MFIVAAHCWSVLIFMSNDFSLPDDLRHLFHIIETLFHGSTIYFAMISGLLYSLVLRDKSYKVFLKGKARNVLAPYVLSAFYYLFLWHFVGQLNLPEDMGVKEFIFGFSFVILTGQMAPHMWYIPIIMILFLLTPLLYRVSEMKKPYLIIIILLLPLVISRVWPMFSPANIVYFAAPYLAGIMIGKNLESAFAWISERSNALLVISILFSVLYFTLFTYDIKDVSWGFLTVNAQETVTYIIRISLALVIFRYLYIHVKRVPKVINLLANHSFAIYFLHMIVIQLMIYMYRAYEINLDSAMNTFLAGLLIFVSSIIISTGLSWIIQKIAGKKSRLIIGA